MQKGKAVPAGGRPGNGRKGPDKIPEARSRRRLVAGLLVGLVGLQVFSPATLVVLAIGIVPAVFALFIDPDRNRRSARSIALLNLAGVLPVVAWLWQEGATRHAATKLLSDPLTWLFMYGGAGLAVAMISGLPPLIGAYVAMRNAHKAKQIEEEMEDLRAEWGEDLRRGQSSGQS